jgi:hypothetical protein
LGNPLSTFYSLNSGVGYSPNNWISNALSLESPLFQALPDIELIDPNNEVALVSPDSACAAEAVEDFGGGVDSALSINSIMLLGLGHSNRKITTQLSYTIYSRNVN